MLRFFKDIDEVTVVESLGLFYEMWEERGNENNIDLEFNLEILQGALAGKIDVTQEHFNVYGYNVICAENETKNRNSQLKKESFLFGGSAMGEELLAQLKQGGISEDTVSFRVNEKKDIDEFSGGDYEKCLIFKNLVGIQKSWQGKGFLLGRIITKAFSGNKSAIAILKRVIQEETALKDLLQDAKGLWEYVELGERLEMVGLRG